MLIKIYLSLVNAIFKRPVGSRYSLVFLGPIANDDFVPKFRVSLDSCAAFPILA